ncbi:hypothetical protein [Filimonas effusa]|uniref:Uncharacterized protein n=1 Tax=Filimonas effusa TaxID=2508721 RepID=A0A4Q1DA53_9BACT|nr:hypothetical protein [Filimonas effusa]RXK86251.1 hypothetical protein ESB13_05435 [Filimonas effusa]
MEKKAYTFSERLHGVMALIGWGACLFGLVYYLDHKNDKHPRDLGPIYRISKGDSIYTYKIKLIGVVEKQFDVEKYDPRY